MFERPQAGERAVLVHLALQAEQQQEEPQEFRELALSAGAEPIAVVTGSRSVPHPRYFVGSGKAEEIRDTVRELDADLVLFNHALSPVQERNLEQLLQCRVLDRTGLILDIFAQRARTHEGKLQVELAQLKHLSTRLVRGWTHLERQKGGIGLRGPGETQLETDRRLLGDRIRQLNKRLEKVQRQREQGRRARKRAEIPTVSLVGYTNAGKSTLFNRLTESHVYAADQLFATLDPTLRRLELADGQKLILADTVGFIRHLPHDLVAAFRSTLQETRDADLLLHVVDASSPEREANMEQVNAVLSEIDARAVPQLLVYNKIDRLDDTPPHIEYDEQGLPWRVWISAQSGAGLEQLREALAARLDRGRVCHELLLPVAEGRLHALLHEVGKVHREQVDEQGNWLMTVEMPRPEWQSLDKHHGISNYLARNDEALRLAAGSEAP
ncbi:ribosome rescue GTPase HflX [Thiohalophilus thiocyanatoxydans]|uniref:GTPase HflX n=1 Tax=Thiohalophilus thiocyanatoxydans TaxID=381308 RepID=A0A4R8IP57_9GAMM|nr:ribosome rescue GTPase HflX [Thiohalophilus thiocyanatoxydans]TDX99276.1 GTP-binding protein HflX [Thiohalophilus thiocyanatoxydans]